MVIARGFCDFLSRTLDKRSDKQTKKKKKRSEQRQTCDSLWKKLELGERIHLYIRQRSGDAFADRLLNGEQMTMPRGFWCDFVGDELQLDYNTRARLRCHRALQLFLRCRSEGKVTKLAMLNGAKARAGRKRGSEGNATKCSGIGFALLQYFVDEVQSLRSRADSQMLLDKARQLRFALMASGWLESDLPNLDGRAGISWFQRWRHEHRLVVKANGLQIKVAWRKIVRRCRVLLTNQFRVMSFFAMCHPGQLLCECTHVRTLLRKFRNVPFHVQRNVTTVAYLMLNIIYC